MSNWENNWGQNQNDNNDHTHNEFGGDNNDNALDGLLGENENQDTNDNLLDGLLGENENQDTNDNLLDGLLDEKGDDTGDNALDGLLDEDEGEGGNDNEDEEPGAPGTDADAGESVKEVEEVEEVKESVPLDFPSDIADTFVVIPNGAKNAPAFSEKGVYKIINLVKVMEVAEEDERKIIATVFGVRGTIMRKAMSLADMEAVEISDKIMSISVLGKIAQAASGKDIGDPMDFAIDLFSSVDKLSEEQRLILISLVKSYQDEAKVKRIKANRSTATAELIREVKDALSENTSVFNMVDETNTIISVVEEAVK